MGTATIVLGSGKRAQPALPEYTTTRVPVQQAYMYSGSTYPGEMSIAKIGNSPFYSFSVSFIST